MQFPPLISIQLALSTFINFSSILISPLMLCPRSLSYRIVLLALSQFFLIASSAHQLCSLAASSLSPWLSHSKTISSATLPFCSRYCLVQCICLKGLNLVGSLGLKATQSFCNHWQKIVLCSIFSIQHKLLWNEEQKFLIWKLPDEA